MNSSRRKYVLICTYSENGTLELFGGVVVFEALAHDGGQGDGTDLLREVLGCL